MPVKTSRRRFLGVSAAMLGGVPAASANQPVRWIVPHPPGGGYDNYSRLLQPFPERELGRSIYIDNVDGAGGIIGAQALSQAPPNGSTLGIVNMPSLLMAAFTDAVAPDPFRGFTLLGTIAHSSYLWATSPDSPLQSLDDMAALQRKRPLIVGATSVNNLGFLSCAMALDMLGWRAAFVTGYRGATDRLLAVMRGEVDFAPLSWDSLVGPVAGGNLRALAATAPEPERLHPAFAGLSALAGPDGLVVRTAPSRAADAEALVRFMEAGRVLVAPPGLDPPHAHKLREAVCRALKNPKLAAAGEARNTTVQPSCGPTTQSRLRSVEQDVRRLSPLARRVIAHAQGDD